MKKTLLRKVVMLITALTVGFAFSVTAAFGAEEGQEIVGADGSGLNHAVIGEYNAAGQIVFKPQGQAEMNTRALKQLCEGDEAKTIVIPSGSNVKISYVVPVGSNTTIIATGATITQTDKTKGVLRNDCDALNYNSVKKVKIIGGTWKNAGNSGKDITIFRFAHGQDIVLDGCEIACRYTGHAVELIGCKNVTVQNCNIYGVGAVPKKCVEEQIQIDIATPKTAPGVKNEFGSKYVNGATCKNIKILNNKVKGARGVCSNYASNPKEKKFKNKFHSNITVTGNTITGVRSEALALFNTTSATVKNNKITYTGKKKNDAYTIGLHCALFGTAPKSIKSAKITISGNTIKGGRQALQVYSHTKSKYGKVSITNNKLYCIKGKKEALKAPKKSISKVTTKKNKTYKWSGK